ncbi:MAG: FHA domain-containing protein [Gemmatimonadetes bacterium]|nr:MAG: FHA domain-containing protein [Gemmatimonadota bacterium]
MEIRIGRAEDNDLIIDDRTVSKNHAKITREGRIFFIEDLGSANGTWINGKRIRKRTQIHESDKIELGKHILTPAEKMDIFESVDQTLIVTGMQSPQNVTVSRTGSPMIKGKYIVIGFGLAALITLIFVLQYGLKPHSPAGTVESIPPAKVFELQKDAVVLVLHRYIGAKGGMFLCENSPALQQAAVEHNLEVSPDSPYALIPNEELARQYPFQTWGSGVCISPQGELLTHTGVGNPTYALEEWSLELGIPFEGETVEMRVWFNGSKPDAALPAHWLESPSVQLEQLALLKLDSPPANLAYVPLNRLQGLDQIQIDSPVTFVGFTTPEQIDSEGNQTSVAAISLAGTVRHVAPSRIEYDFIVPGIASLGAPVFDNKGNVIAIHVTQSDSELSYGVNEFVMVSGLLNME